MEVLFGLIFGVFFVIGIIIYMIIDQEKNKMEIYSMEFKNKYVKEILKGEFKYVSFSIDGEFDNEPLVDINYHPIRGGSLERFVYPSDFFKGKYKDVNFVQNKLKVEEIEEKSDSEGHIYHDCTLLFDGIVTSFEYDEIHSSVMVTNNKKIIKNIYNGYEKLSLEDVSFNKNYLVFAEKEHDGFLFLTPRIIEIVKKLDNEILDNISFMIMIYKNKLYLFQDDVQKFEPTSDESLETIKEEFKDQTNYIKYIIDNIVLGGK